MIYYGQKEKKEILMKPVFRTSMFGFNKQDVTDFMVRQNRQHEEERNQFLADQQQREAALFTREDQCRAIEAKRTEIDAKEKRLESILSLLKGAVDQLKANRASCEESLEKAEEEWGKLVSENERLSLCREKAQKYDTLAGVLTSIVGGEHSSGRSDADPDGSTVDPEKAMQSLSSIPEGFDDSISVLQDILDQIEAKHE